MTELATWEGGGTDNPWQVVELGGNRLPCTGVKFSGYVGRQFDTKPVPGQNGATTTDKGIQITACSMEIACCKPADAIEVNRVLERLDPTSADGFAGPIPLVHPAPNSRGHRIIRIQKIHYPRIDKPGGTCFFKVEFIPYFPKPRPPVKKPKTSNAGKSDSKDAKKTWDAWEVSEVNKTKAASGLASGANAIARRWMERQQALADDDSAPAAGYPVQQSNMDNSNPYV